MAGRVLEWCKEISIHSPYTGRDDTIDFLNNIRNISIHSPYTGRDCYCLICRSILNYFNPLSLYRERHQGYERGQYRPLHFNPLSLYRERPTFLSFFLYISIHSPYTGRDSIYTSNHSSPIIFQSTLPIQGETADPPFSGTSGRNFNPLSLYRERLAKRGIVIPGPVISIHSPYTGRDGSVVVLRKRHNISIHSPYTGRDSLRKLRSLLRSYFNPLSLYRERQLHKEMIMGCKKFQSTLPIQGETTEAYGMAADNADFNPLSLYRERQLHKEMIMGCKKFQSTLPIQGETRRPGGHSGRACNHFNPLSLYRERPCSEAKMRKRKHFNPLSLYRERLLFYPF